jgi:hypothetical protein
MRASQSKSATASNYVLQDVGFKAYDRWNYMPEKRAGMKRWDKFARAMLAKHQRRMVA